MPAFRNPPPEDLARFLRETRSIAVIGLSDDPGRPSHDVSAYMKDAGYRIIPVNPRLTEVLGERAYPRLADVPALVDLVNVFRRSSQAGAHVDEAIAHGAKGVWLQVGVWDDEAAERAREAGLWVVMDRCIMVDHRHLVR